LDQISSLPLAASLKYSRPVGDRQLESAVITTVDRRVASESTLRGR
jgi:hypothetical protein